MKISVVIMFPKDRTMEPMVLAAFGSIEAAAKWVKADRLPHGRRLSGDFNEAVVQSMPLNQPLAGLPECGHTFLTLEWDEAAQGWRTYSETPALV